MAEERTQTLSDDDILTLHRREEIARLPSEPRAQDEDMDDADVDADDADADTVDPS